MGGPLRIQDFVSEAQAQGFAASYEFPGVAEITDQLGRLIIIGEANGPIGADVYINAGACCDGAQPSASADLQGESIGALLADALNLAARVSPADCPPEPLKDMDGGFYHAPDDDAEACPSCGRISCGCNDQEGQS